PRSPCHPIPRWPQVSAWAASRPAKAGSRRQDQTAVRPPPAFRQPLPRMLHGACLGARLLVSSCGHLETHHPVRLIAPMFMAISRTPYRISFFGGGTDYPDWYRAHGGTVLSMAINKYCYVSGRHLPPFFDIRHRIVWSHIETVGAISEILHPAVRA